MSHFFRHGAVLWLLVALSTFMFAQDEVCCENIELESNLQFSSEKLNEWVANRIPLPEKSAGYRSIDGTGNNLNNPLMGAAFTQLLRAVPNDYADGVSSLAGENRPSAREISNAVCAQPGSLPNSLGLTDYLWQWGQFLDHDIDLTEGATPAEDEFIAIPTGDVFFDPNGTGLAEMEFNRSLYDENTGTGFDNPRQQLNGITAWIDASNVYGSDAERADALRARDGFGRLKTSAFGLFLPYNEEGLPNAGGPGPELFLAGDVRANEQVGLAALHTLFVREHNFIALGLKLLHPNWNDEKIYQKARQLVGAQIQVITYNEFLPALLGTSLPPYQGYNPQAQGSIVNLFSTAVYRFGHSALNPQILRLNHRLEEIPEGHLPLRDAFFSPNTLVDEGGLAPVLRGLANQLCQDIDPFVVDDVRNFLFGPPGSGGFDLASLNIQRGRDHGLPGYNAVRVSLGLAPKTDFADVSSNPTIQSRLSSVYEDVDEIDLWVGALSEDHLPGALVGELAAKVITDQFIALRDGDRYWYARMLNPVERFLVENTTLADIIRRNTFIRREISDDVFHMP